MIAGEFEAFDMHGPFVASLTDNLGGATRALGEEFPKGTPPFADQLQRAEEAYPVAEARPLRGITRERDTTLYTFHCPGDGAASADGIHPVVIAKCGCAEDNIRVLNAAEGSEGEERLVLQADRDLWPGIGGAEVMLAADGAGGTGLAVSALVKGEAFTSERLGGGETAGLEVACWEHTKPAEEGEVRNCAQFAVLGSLRPEAPCGKPPGGGCHTGWIGNGRESSCAAHRNRFEALSPEDCTRAGSTSEPAIVHYGSVADESLAGAADGGDADISPEFGAERGSGGFGVVAEKVIGRA
jgi:hypothetical protein